MHHIPNYEEQKLVRDYVMERMLHRPDTDVRKSAKYVALFLSVWGAISGIIWTLCLQVIFPHWQTAALWFQRHPVLSVLLTEGILFLCCLLPVLKTFLIGLVKFYQHYAPEDMRRQCMCKPTCSEYAILVLQKYGVLRGIPKIYVRLFHTCHGSLFFIDEP